MKESMPQTLHHPVKDNARGISWDAYKRRMPVLSGRADLHIADHLHSFDCPSQKLGATIIVVASGGQVGRHDSESDAFYVKNDVNGFGVLEANDQNWKVHLNL